MAVTEIKLDAARWETIFDFYGALTSALGAPPWHGQNINAVIESVIYGGINKLDPPYSVRIENLGQLPAALANDIRRDIALLEEARDHWPSPDGREVDVDFEILS